MKVILLEKVHNLGNLGDTVEVKPGYGRNYLIPQGKAVSATKANIAKFESRREEFEKKAEEKLASAQKRAAALKDFSITITRKALEEGKLYGSIGIRDVMEEIEKSNIKVEKKEVVFPEGTIHQIGEYEIQLRLHSDVIVPIKIKVQAEA